MDAAGDVLQQDGLAAPRRRDDQPALTEPDGGEDIDDAGGQLDRVVLELEHRLGVEGGGIVKGDLLDIFVRGTAFDAFDLAEHAAPGQPAEQEPGPQPHLANDLPAYQWVAPGGAERVGRIAEVAILPLVDHLENPFNGGVRHKCIGTGGPPASWQSLGSQI